VVIPEPTFTLYALLTRVLGGEILSVPLGGDLEYDASAIRSLRREAAAPLTIVCSPNNPTGGVLESDAIERLCEEADGLVVIDEAYHEFVTDPRHRTAVPLAVDRPNVVVLRTFSKIFGLATLRVGYAISRPSNIVELRKAQAPFTVSSLGQAAAITSLEHVDEVMARVPDNTAGRTMIEEGLSRLGVTYVPSQANFVYFRLGSSTEQTASAFLDHGLIIRPFSGGWVRVSVGTEEENRRFLAAVEAELPLLF
jgi:histidinol-phosphate aminotransferase